ncbi:killer cell lectin-like receptor subfamily B member 1 [Microtus ochrogaster]|uniref:Killer cell lectin-like receptor subfamily B member 1 n=1 Tax=Microtus ochrogaster TaxID=79684 RepID=A0ABM0LMY0_MICOH|nr:killer cell lectin-like receptor subfamily B member 1 [Microtus ochrogaster]
MDTSPIYATINFAEVQELKLASSSLPADTCQCPLRRRLTLKLDCAGLILVLILIGISVAGTSAVLTCPRDWHPCWDKCLFISQITGSWVEGQADCSVKGATLLLIENEEELKFIWDFTKTKSTRFFIGLNYVPAEKIWKWVNGSILNPDVLQITVTNEDNRCAIISGLEVLSEECSLFKHYICQKKLKPV